MNMDKQLEEISLEICYNLNKTGTSEDKMRNKLHE